MSGASAIIGLSNAEIVMALGKRYKIYRLLCRLTQREVAARSGISVVTLRHFESGKACNITMANFLSLLRAIGHLELVEVLLPENPLSPYVLQKVNTNIPNRIRHGRK